MIDWKKISKYEMSVISRIADRAVAMAAEHGMSINKLDMNMDLSAAHIEVHLRLDELLAADDGTFGHDVFGIRRHMNRVTARLEGCFLPRLRSHTS